MSRENINLAENKGECSDFSDVALNTPVDLDGDGVTDSVLNIDNNGDGILISDTDGNGCPDLLVDLGNKDSDGFTAYLDVDEDGTVDIVFEDEEGDGVWDVATVDADGDGVYETPINDVFV